MKKLTALTLCATLFAGTAFANQPQPSNEPVRGQDRWSTSDFVDEVIDGATTGAAVGGFIAVTTGGSLSPAVGLGAIGGGAEGAVGYIIDEIRGKHKDSPKEEKPKEDKPTKEKPKKEDKPKKQNKKDK